MFSLIPSDAYDPQGLMRRKEPNKQHSTGFYPGVPYWELIQKKEEHFSPLLKFRFIPSETMAVY